MPGLNQYLSGLSQYISSHSQTGTINRFKLLRRGIQRELEIIGEATTKILKIDDKIEISNSRRIVDFRNWVIRRSGSARWWTRKWV
jgi:uncharacterized protein with HEPN domain